jgi:hypothetical protein
LLELELGANLVPQETATDHETTRVSVRCAEGAIVLHVDDPVTGKALERRLALAAMPEHGRARLLALAIAELISASWIELEADPAPVVSPDVTASPQLRAVVRDSLDEHHIGWELGLAGSTRAFVGQGVAIGGGLQGEAQLPSWLTLGIDLLADRHSTDVMQGTAEATTLSAGAAALVRDRFGALAVEAGIGGRMGMAVLAGHPFADQNLRGQTLVGAWGGPLACVHTHYAFGRVAIATMVETGWALLPITGRVNGGPAVRVAGGWLGVTLALGLERK